MFKCACCAASSWSTILAEQAANHPIILSRAQHVSSKNGCLCLGHVFGGKHPFCESHLLRHKLIRNKARMRPAPVCKLSFLEGVPLHWNWDDPLPKSDCSAEFRWRNAHKQWCQGARNATHRGWRKSGGIKMSARNRTSKVARG